MKEEVASKYGTDDHEVTRKMAEELGVDARIIFLVKNMGNIYALSEPANSGDWELKIATYADCRVAPNGIVGAKERLDDLIARNAGRPIEAVYRAIPPLVLELEEQVFANALIRPQDVSDKTVAPYILKYKQRIRSR